MEKRRRLRRRQINRVPYLLAACRSSLILRLSSSSHPGQSSRRSFVQMDQRNSDGSVSYRKRYSRIQTLFSSGFLFLSLSLALALSLSLSLSLSLALPRSARVLCLTCLPFFSFPPARTRETLAFPLQAWPYTNSRQTPLVPVRRNA